MERQTAKRAGPDQVADLPAVRELSTDTSIEELAQTIIECLLSQD
jgi:hypothetical protein